MLRKICIVISGLILPLLMLSQEFYPGSGLNLNKGNSEIAGKREFHDSVRIKQPRLRYSLSTGMSFVSWRGMGTMTTQFISPSIYSRINRKFGISGGVQISNININHKESEGVIQENPGTVTSAILWIRGDYQVNSMLGFSGTVYKDFIPVHQHHSCSMLDTPQNEGFRIDMRYRPSRNLEINAGFGYHKGSTLYTGYGDRLWGESPLFYPGIFENGPGF